VPLSPEIIRHIEGSVMIIVAVRDAECVAIGRAAGATFRNDGSIELRISRQWDSLVMAAEAGKPLAATFTEPATYRSYQIKGPILSRGEGDQSLSEHARTYARQMLRRMATLGITAQQLAQTLPTEELICLSFRPDAVYEQTPGPRAGLALPDAQA